MKLANHHITQDHCPPIESLLLFQTLKIINMKKIILFFTAVFFLSFSSIAQLDKKTWLVGGSGSFSSYKQDFKSTIVETVYKVTDVKISPNIGYFVMDKFAVGLKSTLSWWKDKGVSANVVGNSSTTLRIDYGPFVRYYFLDKEKPFNILADLSYQFGNVKFKGSDKGSRNNFSIMAGPAIFFNSSVGLEFLFGYRYESEKEETTTYPNPYKDTKKGIQLEIGLQIHLEKL